MTTCVRHASGAIELYFYDELEAAARADIGAHLRSCGECRGALEELELIRAALESRPVVDAPPDGDWSPFMHRLDETIGFEQHVGELSRSEIPVASENQGVAPRDRTRAITYLAMAALLALVTSGVAYVARSSSNATTVAAPTPAAAPDAAIATPAPADFSANAGFAALSEQHFERSKLVVLGLANKSPEQVREADWAYERGLASDLLNDTRVYRQAAEQRGMKTLAGVMGDLELVLLQTSLADAPDAGALEQIQRLIHKRDLVTKMEAATRGL